MSLLVDHIGFVKTDQKLIKEAIEKDKNARVVVESVLQRADFENQNERIYPKEVLVKSAKIYKETFVADKRALGELDHSDKEIVELKNVSHNIVDMWWDGDELVGRIEILSTPSGNILKQLLAEGVKIGISSRATGSLKPVVRNGKKLQEVQDDLMFICWDFVSNPSTSGAFVNVITPLKESFQRSNLISYKNRNVDRIKKINKIIYNIISLD